MAALTCVAALVERGSRRRKRRFLRELAVRWGMTYSPGDRLRVAAKIAGKLPIPGAADLTVADVVYGAQGDQYCYVFTAEFTIGVIRGKRRQVRVATYCEPRDCHGVAVAGSVVLAPEGLSIFEQYEKFAPMDRATQGAKAHGH